MEQNSSPTLEEMFGKRILQIRKEMNYLNLFILREI